MHGIVVVLKPPGMTSHDVVAMLRRLLGERRIGHSGTLDPGAAGLLVLCVGHATRLLPFMEDHIKGYRAELRLGWATDTQDAGGEIAEERRDFELPIAVVERAFSQLRGESQQIPPMVSALKYGGQRLYELARQGKTVARRPRWVMIYSLQSVGERGERTLRYGDRVFFDVICSKGTYVRTLCHDIGTLVGVPAHMSFLLRTRVGPWELRDAVTLETVSQLPRTIFRPLEEGIGFLPGVVLSKEGTQCLWQGTRARGPQITAVVPPLAEAEAVVGKGKDHGDLVRVYDEAGDFVGVGRNMATLGRGQEIQPLRMLPFTGS